MNKGLLIKARAILAAEETARRLLEKLTKEEN